MSDLICIKTMMRCPTPGTCSPHGGCQSQHYRDSSELHRLCAERDTLRTANQRLEGEVARLAASMSEHLSHWKPKSRKEMDAKNAAVELVIATLSTANGEVTEGGSRTLPDSPPRTVKAAKGVRGAACQDVAGGGNPLPVGVPRPAVNQVVRPAFEAA